MRSLLLTTLVAIAVAEPTTSGAATNCATGATCHNVDAFGKTKPGGAYLAQCSGRFPDSIDRVPSGYAGPRFRLSQDYPPTPGGDGTPWLQHDFRDPAQADAYLNALLEYAYDGMIEAGWRAEKNGKRHWYHVPWMTAGSHLREFVLGMTDERPITGPELGLKPGVTVQNWAVGFYNSVGGYTLGRIWAKATPDFSKAQFEPGTAVIKLLFTDARPEDFAAEDILDGAPQVEINRFRRGTTEKEIGALRLLQIDVAARDSRAKPSEWIYGTFAYDRTAAGSDSWRRMRPVGLMWGNDPSLGQAQFNAGQRVRETLISGKAPGYARNHLGWLGRVNGPVDNPASSCLSCHGTAQTIPQAPMTWSAPQVSSHCNTDAKKRQWFRNLDRNTAFGEIRQSDCALLPGDASVRSLDFSLQLAVALTNIRSGRYSNPCGSTEAAELTAGAESPKIKSAAKAPAKNRYPVER
jgi:hypothetical protein